MSLSTAFIIAAILMAVIPLAVGIVFSAFKIGIVLALGKNRAEKREAMLSLLLREQRRR